MEVPAVQGETVLQVADMVVLEAVQVVSGATRVPRVQVEDIPEEPELTATAWPEPVVPTIQVPVLPTQQVPGQETEWLPSLSTAHLHESR